MNRIKVHLGERSYPIYIGAGILSQLGEYLARAFPARQTAVITNPIVKKLYGEKVVRSLKRAGFQVSLITIPDGERYKSIETLQKIFDKLIRFKIERGAPLVALGGGVVGDIGGFAAATYLRGVPYVQVPTTLLAHVDSSVGGKTAVDHPKGKNLIGAFYQPRLVFIDVKVLRSLPEREFRSGLSEVIKYGVIRDPRFFSYLERHAGEILKRKEDVLAHVVRRSCRIKADVVEQDEQEVTGLRAILNFGHTMAHALETLEGYKRLLHGEAVAMGMTFSAELSRVQDFCREPDVERLKSLITRFGLKTYLPGASSRKILDVMRQDKKVKGGEVSFVFLKNIGEVFVSPLPWSSIRQFLGKM